MRQKSLTIILFMWSIAIVFYAFEMMLKSSTGAMANTLIHKFQATSVDLSILDSSFFIVYVILQLPAGMLVDRYGVRPTLAIAILFAAIGSIVFSMADSMSMLIIARGLMGVSGAFGFICTITLASQWFSRTIFPLIARITNFVGYLGAAASGGPLTITLQYTEWRILFFRLGITAIILLFLSTLFIRDNKAYFTQHAHPPLFRKKLTDVFKMCMDRSVMLNGIFSATTQGVTFALANLWGKIYLVEIWHHSENDSAFIGNTMIFLGVACTAPLWGFLALRIKNQRLLVSGAVIGLLSTTLLLYTPLPVVAAIIVAFLIGMAQSSHVLNYDNVKCHVPSSQLSSSFAFINLCGIAGGAITQLLIGTTMHITSQGSALTTFNYKVSLILVPVLFLAAFITALLLKSRKAQHVSITH